MPSVIEAALLPRLVGVGHTAELVLLGENIDAARALAIGLVEKVVPPDELDSAVDTWIDAPFAVPDRLGGGPGLQGAHGCCSLVEKSDIK